MNGVAVYINNRRREWTTWDMRLLKSRKEFDQLLDKATRQHKMGIGSSVTGDKKALNICMGVNVYVDVVALLGTSCDGVDRVMEFADPFFPQELTGEYGNTKIYDDVKVAEICKIIREALPE